NSDSWRLDHATKTEIGRPGGRGSTDTGWQNCQIDITSRKFFTNRPLIKLGLLPKKKSAAPTSRAFWIRAIVVSTETLAEGLNGFGSGAILIGEGRRADRVFTKAEFVSLCHYMLNENAQTEFLHAYIDSECSPRFVKAKSTHADRRIAWAWDTISGRAKRNIAIGFYPWNLRGLSRWGAMDFD